MDWATRYGASVKASPPTSAAGSGSPSARSQSAVSPPAPDVGQEDEEIPADDGAEQGLERAEDGGERPAGEIDTWLDLGLEAVWVEPRRLAARQLVARQPEVVGGLQMVARRDAPLARSAVAEEVICLEDGRRGGEQPRAEVEGDR